MTSSSYERDRPGRTKIETSIVVRMFNEERHLEALFSGIEAQTYRDFEIVVVDSGSFDRSRDISEEYADSILVIPSHDFTFGHSLNVGIAASRGKYIVIVSAHTIPVSRDWLGKMVEPLRDEKTAMVYGCQRGAATSKYGELLDFERTFGRERKVLVPPDYFANNANSAVKKSLWLEHAFDETLPGLEDIEWAKYWMERGHVVQYEPEAAIYHIHDESWPQVRRRYFREGQAAKWIGVRRRRDLPLEVWREIRSFFGDLSEAARERRILRTVREITRFRYEKTLGTCGGIWSGGRTDNPLLRERLLFDRPFKAVVIHRPGKASLDDMSIDQVRPSEVLIRVAFQAVCVTDLEILDGHLGYYKNGLASYPIVPGHEFSGTIVRTGARVTDLREGDRVVVECIQGCGQCAECTRDNAIGCTQRTEMGVMRRNGGYGEYVLASARFVHKLPANVDLKHAVLCEPLAVVMKGMRRLGSVVTPGPNRSAAVIGAGSIGHLTALTLAARGYKVTAIDRNPDRLTPLQKAGIRTQTTLEGLASFGVVIEATGDADSLERALQTAKAGTVFLLLGFPYGARAFNFERVVGYDLNLVGSVGSTAADFEEALRNVPHLDLSAFFQVELPLAEFERAWEIARSRTYLKVILRVDESIHEEMPQAAANRLVTAAASAG